MRTWKAYFQINGYDFSRYPVIEFPVSKELYEQIQSSIAQKRPLRDCPFHDELLRHANDALNLDDYRPDYADLFPEESKVFVASCTIDDPGDLVRLEDLLRGRYLCEAEVSFSDEYETVRYSVLLILDDSGAISEVQSVCAEGLESESVNRSSCETCYPDYPYITSVMLKLSSKKED